jgi:hypothetical protein
MLAFLQREPCGPRKRQQRFQSPDTNRPKSVQSSLRTARPHDGGDLASTISRQ